MKRIFKLTAILTAALMTLASLSLSASAKTANEAKNSVVYIESTFTSQSDRDLIFQGVYGDPNEFYWLHSGETVYSRGSGFAIGEVGEDVSYIVTNAHVVLDDTAEGIKSLDPLNKTLNLSNKKANEVRVYFSYGANDYMRAQIYMVNEEKDICILKLPQPTDKREPLVICKSSEVDMDDDFSALGFPADSDWYMDNTSLSYDADDVSRTSGSISRKSTDSDGIEVYLLDMNISPGNSGGALVNSKGEVVGIPTYKIGGSKNYAIVIDELLNLINRDTIPYTLSNEVNDVSANAPEETEAAEAVTEASAAPKEENNSNTLIIVIIIAAAVVVAAAAVVVVVVKGSKKGTPAAPAAPQQHTPVITGIKGFMTGRSFTVAGSVIIGRNAQKCTVCYPVDAQGISGVHCEVRQFGNEYQLVDLGSSCGTFLPDGQRLVPNVPVTLKNGMFFCLGSNNEMFRFDA